MVSNYQAKLEIGIFLYQVKIAKDLAEASKQSEMEIDIIVFKQK